MMFLSKGVDFEVPAVRFRHFSPVKQCLGMSGNRPGNPPASETAAQKWLSEQVPWNST